MSTISRSEYQKVCEENKKLRKDIEILVGGVSAKRVLLTAEYRKKIKDKNFVSDLLKEYAKSN